MAQALKTMTSTLTGAWDAITIPACRGYTLQARTAVDIKITEQSSGTPYFTLKAGGSIDSPDGQPDGGMILYVNGAVGVVVEVLYFAKQ
jgi:hypothetical protein